MTNNNSLINLGDLSKPAAILVEKICNSFGAIFQPAQIKRIAQAEAEAKIIHAFADVQVQDIQRRAMIRFIGEETRKQENIENITAKAIPQLLASANPHEIEDDWIMHFFDKCKVISDDSIQVLWSKILAGEANTPGSYSKRTIELLSDMSKKDAELFLKLCRHTWVIGAYTPVILDCSGKIYNDDNINFNALTHLDQIGLISFNNLSGFRRIKLPKKILIRYYDKNIELEFTKDDENELAIGKVLFSQAGEELASICNSNLNEESFNYVVDYWKKAGIIVNLK